MTISNEALQDSLSFLPSVVYEYVLYEDRSSEFLYMSSASKEILGHPPEYFMKNTIRLWGMVHPDDVSKLYNDDVNANIENIYFVSEVRLFLPSGVERWIQFSSKPTSKKKNNSVIWSGYIIDITERKIEEERSELVTSPKIDIHNT